MSIFNLKIQDTLEKIILGSLMIAVAMVLFYICFTAEATFDSGDGVSHFLISKYSWKHPGLLLDHWGKPFFTLVSSPFSQFGLVGMSVFQILCALSASYFCFRIAKRLRMQFAWTFPIFIFFAPVYFAVINSGLTEIFFSCLLMFSIWMIFEKKFIVAAIAASFLLFVRVDAYVTVPLIALVLLLRKQFTAFAFLPFGFIIYSLVGYFYYGDILWVIHQSQNFFDEGYPGAKGEFFHYPEHYSEILGTAFSLLLLIGLGWRMFSLIFSFHKSKKQFLTEELLLIFGCFISCFLIHALAYWMPGIKNNLGMIRYMATIIPCASLIALLGLNVLVQLINKVYLKNLFLFTFLIFIIFSPFKQYYFPYRLDGEPRVAKETVLWIKKNNLNYTRLCYFNPALPLFYDIDPFDDKKIVRNININEPLPSQFFPAGSILIWDSHYGANEGGIPPEKLDSIPALQLLQKFKPEESFTVLGGREFEVRIYKVK